MTSSPNASSAARNTVVAVVLLLGVIVFLIFTLHIIEKERDTALAVVRNLSTAHESYLLKKYKETKCGIVESSIPSYGEASRFTERDQVCVIGVEQVVKADMAKLMRVKE